MALNSLSHPDHPLRILQIVPSISLVYGGPSQMVLGLSAALATLGVEVTIITTDANGDEDQPPLEVALQKPISQDGYEIIYFRCSPWRRYKFSWQLAQWLWHNAHRYDVAHIHALFSPVSTIAATIARLRHLPYILRPLGTLDPIDLQKKKYFKQIYGWFWEKANLRGAAAVHFTSQQEAATAHRFGAKTKDVVIPLGVNPPFNLDLLLEPSLIQSHNDPANPLINFDNPANLMINPGVSSGADVPAENLLQTDSPPIPLPPALGSNSRHNPLILFLSRLDRKKGLDLLIPALEDLLAEGWKFHFVLAGTNPQDQRYESQIKSQIANSPLGKSTIITGFVTGQYKQQLLQQADILVLPSYYENFGIAVAEAMIVGTAVVISDQVHIWQEVATANAGWICSCDRSSLTNQLRAALGNELERQQRGKNAQRYAWQNYRWEAIAQRTQQLYQNIAHHSSRVTTEEAEKAIEQNIKNLPPKEERDIDHFI